jgi:uncharacterized protein (DUF885 family)
MRHPILSTLLIVTTLGSPAAAGALESFADDYLADYFAAHPVRATQLGIHEHDGSLPDLSAPAVRARVKALRAYLKRLLAIERRALSLDASLDHRLLEHAIRAELLELEEVQDWRRNPMLYNRLLADGVASLVDREFAPLAERLTALTSRLEGYGAMTRTARKNLKEVPAAWADLAVSNTRGHLAFLEQAVPQALTDQGLDEIAPAARARWALARRGALTELRSFLEWLQRDLKPRAKGDFRLGRETFERKLLYEEHVATGVGALTAMNERAIRDYDAWIAREAARIDPERPAAAVMDEITADHPTPDTLIETARKYVFQARDFILEHALVTLPGDGLPVVRPTPEFARAGFASMSTPGPFETGATESYYNITNVDPAWSEAQQREHLTYFNYPGLLGVSVHEAMPGHYVQLLYQRELPTDVRKVFAPGTLVEGWAHYVEQMMIDEGLGDGDPAIRLGQLRRALQRHARWYAGIALHTTDASVEATAERFAEIAHFAAFPARRETLRATYNPTYLYYALGRMQILELREAYRQHVEAKGRSFSLREFHDRFLKLGLPAPLAREVMLAD